MNGLAHGNVAVKREFKPPVQVVFLDGKDKLKLGELDLNQLDSFRCSPCLLFSRAGFLGPST